MAFWFHWITLGWPIPLLYISGLDETLVSVSKRPRNRSKFLVSVSSRSQKVILKKSRSRLWFIASTKGPGIVFMSWDLLFFCDERTDVWFLDRKRTKEHHLTSGWGSYRYLLKCEVHAGLHRAYFFGCRCKNSRRKKLRLKTRRFWPQPAKFVQKSQKMFKKI